MADSPLPPPPDLSGLPPELIPAVLAALAPVMEGRLSESRLALAGLVAGLDSPPGDLLMLYGVMAAGDACTADCIRAIERAFLTYSRASETRKSLRAATALIN